MVLRRQCLKHLVERPYVVWPVVGWQRNPRKKYFYVYRRERPENLVEIVLGLGQRQAAQSVVSAELDNHHFRMKAQDCRQRNYRIFCGGPAGALINYFIMIILGVEIALQRIGKRLSRRKSVTGRDAVAEADEDVRAYG